MAFRARTLNAAPNEPNAYSGRAPERVVSGVLIPSKTTALPGEPTAEMLADDRVEILGITGDPWPKSSSDRNCAGKGANAFYMLQMEGKWPSEQEKAAQELTEKKLKNPEGVARFMLREQGLKDEDIDKSVARMKRVTAGFPDLSSVPDTPEPPKRKPGRPRKSETAED